MSLFKKKEKVEMPKIYNDQGERMEIEEIGIPSKYTTYLRKYQVKYVDQLTSKTIKEVAGLPWMGYPAAKEIGEILVAHGYHYQPSKED